MRMCSLYVWMKRFYSQQDQQKTWNHIGFWQQSHAASSSSSSSSSPSAKEWAYLARFFNWKVEAARDATIGTSSWPLSKACGNWWCIWLRWKRNTRLLTSRWTDGKSDCCCCWLLALCVFWFYFAIAAAAPSAAAVDVGVDGVGKPSFVPFFL